LPSSLSEVKRTFFVWLVSESDVSPYRETFDVDEHPVIKKVKNKIMKGSI